jgi:hypothetical protein
MLPPILMIIINAICFSYFLIQKNEKSNIHNFVQFTQIVATLALGLWPRQKGCKVAGQEEARELRQRGRKGADQKGARKSHHILPGMWESVQECEKVWGGVKEWTLTLPRQLPLWETGTPEISESNFRSQNSMACGVFYIIEKLLKRRCIKWARIAHLDIWNTSYGQKKGRESNWQFDSRPLKVKNQPLPDIRFESATWRWENLDKGYNFGSDLVAIGICSRELWAPKVPGKKVILMQPPPRAVEYTIRGKVVTSPNSGPWWVLCVRVARGLS